MTGPDDPASGGPDDPASGGPDPGSPGGRLYVVATPIGNLGDVTFRALEVLRAVPLIAAEDTRLAKRLSARHGIETRTISYHARSGPARTEELLSHLRAGADLALVTDAGTPGVSDPGDALVAAWAAEGGIVIPIPGASAVLAAVGGSGIAGPRWAFEGFLPRSGRARRERLAAIAADGRGTVLFEAPSRLAATLLDFAEACGPERQGAVCRELTKLHEQIARAPLAELAAMAADGRIPARGEVVIVVGWTGGRILTPARGAPADDPVDVALSEVESLVAAGVARGDAARRVARRTGIARRRLYIPPER